MDGRMGRGRSWTVRSLARRSGSGGGLRKAAPWYRRTSLLGTLEGLQKKSRTALWDGSLDHSEASWECLGASWWRLGASWRYLGASWAVFEASLGAS